VVRLMNKTDALRELRSATQDLPARAASARAALNQWRRRAQDLSVQAQSRARGEIDRRRATAAATLEGLAGALRPAHGGRGRRKSLASAAGPGLALTAALGIGVALGFLVSRQLKKRAEERAAAQPASEAAATPSPTAIAAPTATSLDL